MKVLEVVGQKGYNMSCVAASVGSGHPFISHEVFVHKRSLMEKNKDNKMLEKLELVKDFVLDENKLAGPQVCVAKRYLEVQVSDKVTKTTLYATTIQDCHDKKAIVKDLRFFNTGYTSFDNVHVWVGTEKNISIKNNFLFSSVKGNAGRVNIENTLVNYCRPLTVSQRTGDWFLMRKFRITGTVSLSLPTLAQLSTDAEKHPLLDKFNDSHHNREHKSTDNMKQGTNNEAPLMERLGTQDWVHEVYEVGMLEVVGSPWITVSPDAIIVGEVNSSDGLLQEETPQMMFVKMKTRLGSGTISKTVESLKTNGGFVHCCYGDNEFKSCVPSGNRSVGERTI